MKKHLLIIAIAAICLSWHSGAVAKGNANANPNKGGADKKTTEDVGSDKSNKSQDNKGNAKKAEPQDSMASSTENVNFGKTPAKDSTPPGWDQGKKTGWQGGSVPPGWQKWDDNTRTKWLNDSMVATNEILAAANSYHVPETARSQILDGFSQAIVGGIMINDAKDKIIGAMKDNTQRKLLMLNTMQTTLQILGTH